MKISLFNYTVLGYILPITIFLPPRKEILNQTYVLKSTFQTDDLFSIASHPGIFQKNLVSFTRDLCRCFQPCLISSSTFGGTPDFTTVNHKRYKFIMDSIPNDWKHLKLKFLKSKIHFKALCHCYKGTRKVEDF